MEITTDTKMYERIYEIAAHALGLQERPSGLDSSFDLTEKAIENAREYVAKCGKETTDQG